MHFDFLPHSLSSPRPEPFLPGYLYFFPFSFLEYSKFPLAVSGTHTMYLNHTTPVFPSSHLSNITLLAFIFFLTQSLGVEPSTRA